MLDRGVALEKARVDADPASWMRLERLALALHARGQLTGSHADLAEALSLADRARELAPDGSGPVLARAVVSLSMHRNADAEQEVSRLARFVVPAPPGDRAEGEAILGDVALYRGDYRAALAAYGRADAIASGPVTLVRMADWDRHMGRFEEAGSLLQQALADRSSITPWMQAGLLLQLGAIEIVFLASDFFPMRSRSCSLPAWATAVNSANVVTPNCS